MAEQPMETTLHTALWWQFGAAIDMLENALVACPVVLQEMAVMRYTQQDPAE